MRRSKGKSMYNQRKRRGRKSNLYTRNRNDPEPWAGTPPQTPPSSDDEGCENMANIANCQQSLRRRSRKQQSSSSIYGCAGNMRMPYNVNANMPRSNTQNVAPAPSTTQHHRHSHQYHQAQSQQYHQQSAYHRSISNSLNNKQQQRNAQRRPLKTINNVKRNISKYVKMENANVLQSRKYSSKQTKLNHIKTAPVPRPSAFGNDGKKIKSSKQRQKQTAPVPLPPHILSAKLNKLKNMKQQKQSKSLKSKQKRKQTAPAPPPPNAHKMKTKSKSKHCKMVTANAPSNPNKQKKPVEKPFITNSNSNSNHSIPEILPNSQNLVESFYGVAAVSTPPKVSSKNIITKVIANKKKANKNANNKKAEDGLIDICTIPEAYFIGNDQDINSLTFNSKTIDIEKDIDNILNFDISLVDKDKKGKSKCNKKKKIENNADIRSYGTPTSNGSDEIRVHSAQHSPISCSEVIECSYNVLSDFTNSENSLIGISDNSKAESSEDEKKNIDKIEIVELMENEEENKRFAFHNDDKFTLLAEQILSEKCTEQRENTYINDQKSKYYENGFIQPEKEQKSNESIKRSCSFYQKKNIWAEPTTQKRSFVSRTTLGGLLMSGLPPISTASLFN